MSSQYVSDCDLIYQYTGSGSVPNAFTDETLACGQCNGMMSPSQNYFLGWNCSSAPATSPYNLGYNSDCQNVYATLFYNANNGDQKTIAQACQNCNQNLDFSSDFNYNNIGSCASAQPLNIGYNSDGHAWFFNTNRNKNDKSTPAIACKNPSYSIADQINFIKSNYGSNWKIIGQCINQDATNDEITENFEVFSSKTFPFLIPVVIIIAFIALYFILRKK